MAQILCFDPTRRLIYKTFEYEQLVFLPGTPIYNFYLIDALRQSKSSFSNEELQIIDLLARGQARSLIIMEPATCRLMGFIAYRKTGRKLRRFFPFIPWKKGWRTIQILGLFLWAAEEASLLRKALSFFVQSMAPCFVWISAKPDTIPRVFREFGFQALNISDDVVILLYRCPSVEE